MGLLTGVQIVEFEGIGPGALDGKSTLVSVGAGNPPSKDAILHSLGLTNERIAELKTACIVG